MDYLSIYLQYSRLEPLPDQAQKCVVVDSRFQHLQQPAMVQLIKEAFEYYA
jgi:hypothetical protein